MRQLAEKYGLHRNTIQERATKEGWTQAREKARAKAVEKICQKTAQTVADNAALAARIRTKLLAKLEKEIDSLPDLIGSETNSTLIEDGKGEKGTKKRSINSKAFKIRDLTAAYKDLTADMQLVESEANPLLQSLYDLERRCNGD